MAYIDYDYYTELFGSTEITQTEFVRLAQIASDVIDSVVVISFVFADLSEDNQTLVKKAVAYEAELLDSQGGVNAIVGMSAQSINSEQLGDYHVSGGSTAANSVNTGNVPYIDGIPVSPLAISLLRKAGLMNRWAFTEWYQEHPELLLDGE